MDAVTVDDPPERRSYRRAYLWQSVFVMIFVVAAAIAVTWKLAQIPQPAMWQLLIEALFWAFVVFAAWVLRRNYDPPGVNAAERDGLK